MGQTAGFVAGSWIVRQSPRDAYLFVHILNLVTEFSTITIKKGGRSFDLPPFGFSISTTATF